MDDEKTKLLREADWDDIAVRLRKYIGMLTMSRSLPLGNTAEDIIQEAVRRLVSGRRAWDPAKYPLLSHLKWIIKSVLSEKGYYGQEKREPLGNIQPDAVLDDVEHGPQDDETPADEAALKWKALEVEIGDDQELLDYLSAIRLGADGPKAIAELSGIPIERVYELPRKLQKRFPAVRERYNELVKEGALP